MLSLLLLSLNVELVGSCENASEELNYITKWKAPNSMFYSVN